MTKNVLERTTNHRERVFLVFPIETGRRVGRMFVRLALIAVVLAGVPASPALGSGDEVQDTSDKSRLDDRSLLISDGSRFVPKDFYPKFSWETTPRYFMFGDKNRVLRPEQVRFIAEQTDFLCIEKSHGMGELGAAELGAKHEAAAFKKIKPGMKVLFYFNAAFAWPYTSYNENFTSQRIDAHPELKKFLITNPKTGELIKRFGVAYCYDVLNPDFRDLVGENRCQGGERRGLRWCVY